MAKTDNFLELIGVVPSARFHFFDKLV
jgi:hypothetical protein